MPLNDSPHLEPEQRALLSRLVEAWHNVPPGDRQKFLVQNRVRGPHPTIVHDGIPDGSFQAPLSDIQMLHRADYVLFEDDGYGSGLLAPTPEGILCYRNAQELAGQPAERIEESVRKQLVETEFGARFPKAFRKWSEAETLLWSPDPHAQLTTIGHLLREAMQQFANELIRLTETPNAPQDATKTVQRIESVLKHLSSRLHRGERDLLKGLLTYWRGLNELVQRQEHGGLKEGRPLTRDDARRAVLHSLIAMNEIHSIVTRQ